MHMTITVGEFTFEALTNRLKGAWDVIHSAPDVPMHTVGRLTLAPNAITLQPASPRGPLPSQAQMDEFCTQWAAEAKRRREAAQEAR